MLLCCKPCFRNEYMFSYGGGGGESLGAGRARCPVPCCCCSIRSNSLARSKALARSIIRTRRLHVRKKSQHSRDQTIERQLAWTTTHEIASRFSRPPSPDLASLLAVSNAFAASTCRRSDTIGTNPLLPCSLPVVGVADHNVNGVTNNVKLHNAKNTTPLLPT